jgi:hypothetical protein
MILKVLEKCLRAPFLTVNRPDSAKVPGKGPTAMPLTVKVRFPLEDRSWHVPFTEPLLAKKLSPASGAAEARASTAPKPTIPGVRHTIASSNRRTRGNTSIPATLGPFVVFTPRVALANHNNPQRGHSKPHAHACPSDLREHEEGNVRDEGNYPSRSRLLLRTTSTTVTRERSFPETH